MKIENEWLDAEITQLSIETKRKKRRKPSDNLIAFKLFLMLTAVFFYAPVLEAKCSKVIVFKSMHANANKKQMGEGRNFICPKCRTCQWQDSKNADWAGNFHCSSCGSNLGK